MDNQEAFTIIAEFQNWRLAKTRQEHPEFDTLDLNTLTAVNYLALSTFDKDTQIDIVQDRAEQFFVDLIAYHLSDAGLTAISMTRPLLGADLLALSQDTSIQTFFQKYAPLWLLQTIYHHDSVFKSEIKGGAVEDEMFDLNKSNIFILITMKLYHIALVQLVPAFLPYIFWSDLDLFQIKIRNHFKDRNNTKNWLMAAIQCQNADIDDPLSFDAPRFNDLKTKLDLLQPNNRLSNDIVGSLWYTLLSIYSTKNLLNNSFNRYSIIYTNQNILQRIIDTPSNQFNTQINDATTALACDIPTLTGKICNLVTQVALENGFDQVVPGDDFQATATPFTKEFLATTPFTLLQDNTPFRKFLNAIYCACHVGVLAYCILYGHDSNTLKSFRPELMYIGEGLYINKYITGIEQGNVFTVMGDFLRSLTNEMAKLDATNVFSSFQNFVPRLIHSNTSEHITRLVPSFYILTRDQQAYKLFDSMSAVILDWGELTINLHQMDDKEVDNCIAGLFTVIKKAGCAATSTALLLGNVLYGLSLCSRVYPQLDFNMKLYELFIEGQDDISDIPNFISDFIHTFDEKFIIDYYKQVDQERWESYYESLDPRIQEGLEILMEVENDHLNDMFVLLGEMEQRVQEQEFNKFTTQIVTLPNHVNTVLAGDFQIVSGSQATVTITRPSRLIATIQFLSNIPNNVDGVNSIDVTSSLNNQLMTIGGFNDYPWPVGTSISHCRDQTTGCSITEQILQPGVYQYDMRARIRGWAPNALIDAPGAVLFIVPL